MILSRSTSNRRKGAVLLVVLAMLALFAVIGLSFVFYAESRATSARIYREAQLPSDTPNATQAAMQAFGQAIYDTTDGPNGAFSGVRGHSLARAMYGAYYDGNPSDSSVVGGLNSTAYSGVGPVPIQLDSLPVVNFSWLTGNTLIDPERSMTRTAPTDPFNATSRYIGKNVSSTYPDANDMAVAMVNPINGNVLMPSFHRNWLFNNAIYNAAGANEYARQQCLAPSAVATNDWNSANGRYRIIRPRPADHGNTFPFPPPNADGTYTGDVQNLPGAAYPYLLPTGAILSDSAGPVLIPKNDSVWVDIGAPVQIWNGKRIKPLFAFLIVPTNSKVNINSAGNPRGPSVTGLPGELSHDSGMGLFPSEVNPNYVLRSSPYLAKEFAKMKYQAFNAGVNQSTSYSAAPTASVLPAPPGASAAVVANQQRAIYSINSSPYIPIQPAVPPTPVTPPPFSLAPSVQAPLDWDAAAPLLNAMRMQLPGQQGTFNTPLGNQPLSTSPYALAPRWIAPTGSIRYGNGDLGDAVNIAGSPPTPTEQLYSPYLWNPYLWRSVGAANQGRVYTESDLRKLHSKWADDVGLANGSTLGNLLPISLGSLPGISGISSSPSRSSANATRMNITTRSNTLAVPSFMPLTTINVGQYVYGATPFPVAATQQVIGDPATTTYGNNTGGFNNTDFQYNAANQIIVRGVYASLPPLDLNRPLADYRHALAVKYDKPLRPDNVVLPNNAGLYGTWCTANGVTPNAAADASSISGQPLTSLYAAMSDRQEFAKNIYARLVIATGASASYDPATGYCIPNTGITAPEFDALRYLAQLAANIVDYIDSDDVTTTFVWNPVDRLQVNSFDPSIPNSLVVPAGAPARNNFDPTEIGNRVVMGVEKPKLVLNEAYCEAANVDGSSDRNIEARFWLELMNPNSNDISANPLINQGNEVKPYSTLSTTDPRANTWLFYDPTMQTGGTPAYNTYLVDIHRSGLTAVLPNFTTANRTNVFGLTATPPDLRIDFASINNLGVADPKFGYANPAYRTAALTLPQAIGPVGTKYQPVPGINPANQGYLVMGPGGIKQDATNKEFVPVPWTAGAPVGSYTLPGNKFDSSVMFPANPGQPQNQLVLSFSPPTPEANIPAKITSLNDQKPTVVLRRLANPYLPPNDQYNLPATYNAALPPNPYLAVDTLTMSNVADGVRYGSDSGTPGHNIRPTTKPDAINTRHSLSRAHPLASVITFLRSTDVNPAPGATIYETFFRQNGSSTTDPSALPLGPNGMPYATRTPQTQSTFAAGPPVPELNLLLTTQGGNQAGFEWMPFMDRPLVNQLELLHVPAVAPHMLTNQFLLGDASNMIAAPLSYQFHGHVAAWTDSTYVNTPTAGIANQSRLYRALELLQVKPWSYATPIGGRTPGKININMITDPNVLLALADPQSGDFFLQNPGNDPQTGLPFDGIYDASNPSLAANQLNPATTYGKLVSVRGGTTPATSNQINPVTGGTVITPVPGLNDRPFRGLANTWATTTPTPFVNPSNGISDTILNGVFDLPSQKHPYVKNSLARKVMNNLTTTSDTFEIYLTVGYFEVLNSGPYYTAASGWKVPQLGKEVFKDIEGDMRARFYAVVDRTNLTINTTSPTVQGSRPVITELAATMPGLAAAGTSSMSVYATGYTGGITGTPATTIVNPSAITLQYEMSTSDTTPTQIAGGAILKINTGSAEEVVTVLPHTNATPISFDTLTGIATFSVTRTAPQFGITHRAGVRVMNGDSTLGNPGPQPNFDPSLPNYRAVMPYFLRLDP
ncbi:MAG: hypothetical protein U0798_09015 [Gemmataceae bacterium]